MSAYLVSAKHLSSIVDAIFSTHANDHASHATLGGMRDGITREELFADLYRMNTEALSERYGDSDDKDPEYVYTGSMRPSKVRTVKFLNEYLYQCCEGKVPESYLYKTIDDFRNILCREIVRELPDYYGGTID